jgi:hypothetical protein
MIARNVINDTYHRTTFKSKSVMKKEYKDLVKFCDQLLLDEDKLKKQNIKLQEEIKIYVFPILKKNCSKFIPFSLLSKNKMNKEKKDIMMNCDMCGVNDKSVGFAGCKEHANIKICELCDIDGCNYNGWDDECLDCYDNKYKEIFVLKKKIKELSETNEWLYLENEIACDKGCIIGDGNVGYKEWFELCDLDEDKLIKYKEWLGYGEDVILKKN